MAGVLSVLGAAKVPAGKVYTAKDIHEDPHYRARDMLLRQTTRDGHVVEVPGIVPKLSATPGSVRSSAPHLGDDTDAVLREVVGARSFTGNPYDGHTFNEQREQATILTEDTGGEPEQAVVDLGFRGVDAADPGVEIIHRGKFKSLTNPQRRWLERRQAVEPAIGHLKHDNAMDRCWLQGATGDAVHAVLCAAGYNIRWLLRAIVRLGLEGLLAPVFVLLATLATALATGTGTGTGKTGGGRPGWSVGCILQGRLFMVRS